MTRVLEVTGEGTEEEEVATDQRGLTPASRTSVWPVPREECGVKNYVQRARLF